MAKTNKTGEVKKLCEIKRTLQHVRKERNTVKYGRKNDKLEEERDWHVKRRQKKNENTSTMN